MTDGSQRVVVLGGDGFCGWPTALHLSSSGYDVFIVDNLSRREIDVELGVESLTPIRSIEERISAWEEVSGLRLGFAKFNIAQDYDRLVNLLREFQPHVIVHFAEQRAAPYSMKSTAHRRYTVDNNVTATNNMLSAILDSAIDCHVVHLGSMGVYGYGKHRKPIPEGYLEIVVPGLPDGGEVEEILHPFDPGSVYHATKCLDQVLFAYYNKNDDIRITDLHQGIVWGTQTRDTERDIRLINRFDYDGDYGTVLNRFLMQGAIGYPLTVHGAGNQKRAFIHIRDTTQCIRLAIEHPPKTGERVKIINQWTETHRVIDLARMVSERTHVPITHLENPRKEDEHNELEAMNASLIGMGLNPTTLSQTLSDEILDVARTYVERCDRSKIPCNSNWDTGSRDASDMSSMATGAGDLAVRP